MELQVSPDKAIEILKKRLKEIDSFNFEPTSWKGKTTNDLDEIFGILDSKASQIRLISFNTPYSEAKKEVLEKGKKQARQYIESYIDFIREYSEIQNQKSLEIEDSLKEKVLGLESEISYLSSENNTLYSNQEKLLSVVKSKKEEIFDLIDNTVQLKDLTLKKFFELISNLPIKHIIYLVSIIFGLITSSFVLGQKLEKMWKNNNEIDLKLKYSKSLNSIETLTDSISYFKSKIEENKFTKQPLDSINKISVIMFNTLDEAISINFENISKNNVKIKSHGTSILPKEFAKIDLDVSNYKWEARKYINIKKNAETEPTIYMNSIIRLNEADKIKFVKIK